jgi:hypothetical protein
MIRKILVNLPVFFVMLVLLSGCASLPEWMEPTPDPYGYEIVSSSNPSLDFIEIKGLLQGEDDVEAIGVILAAWQASRPDRELVSFDMMYEDQYHGSYAGIFVYSKAK